MYPHIPHVAFNSKRKATPYLRIFGIWVGVFQGATRQYSLLGVVESDCAKLFPVGYERRLGDDLVQSDVTLP
jgi:hypothetical protein